MQLVEVVMRRMMLENDGEILRGTTPDTSKTEGR